MAVRVANQREMMRLVAIAEATHGYPLSVEIREWKPTRSSEQNAYLWACYRQIGDAKGYDAEAIHEYILGRYFGWMDVRVPKTPRNPEGIASVPIRTTTRPTKLTKAEFADYIEHVQRIGAEAGVFLPDPEQKAA